MFSKDFKEISAGEFFSTTGGLIAGIFLAHLRDQLILIPGLLILIPGFLEMKGNITASLSSRLSSALHMGQIVPKIKNHPYLRENILAAILLSIVVSLALGIVSLLATYIFFKVFYIKILLISLMAVIVANILLIPLTTITCFWLFRKGHDPDNIMGPYITTVGDVISVLSLFLSIMVIT